MANPLVQAADDERKAILKLIEDNPNLPVQRLALLVKARDSNAEADTQAQLDDLNAKLDQAASAIGVTGWDMIHTLERMLQERDLLSNTLDGVRKSKK